MLIVQECVECISEEVLVTQLSVHEVIIFHRLLQSWRLTWWFAKDNCTNQRRRYCWFKGWLQTAIRGESPVWWGGGEEQSSVHEHWWHPELHLSQHYSWGWWRWLVWIGMYTHTRTHTHTTSARSFVLYSLGLIEILDGFWNENETLVLLPYPNTNFTQCNTINA